MNENQKAQKEHAMKLAEHHQKYAKVDQMEYLMKPRHTKAEEEEYFAQAQAIKHKNEEDYAKESAKTAKENREAKEYYDLHGKRKGE